MQQTIKKRFEKGTRFYLLILQRDLLNDWVITRVNGRKNSALGHIEHQLASGYEAGIIAFNDLCKYRKKRKYFESPVRID